MFTKNKIYVSALIIRSQKKKTARAIKNSFLYNFPDILNTWMSTQGED